MKKVIYFLLYLGLSVGLSVALAKQDICIAGGYFPSCAGYNTLSLLLAILILLTSYSYCKSAIKIYIMERDNKIKAAERAEAIKAEKAKKALE